MSRQEKRKSSLNPKVDSSIIGGRQRGKNGKAGERELADHTSEPDRRPRKKQGDFSTQNSRKGGKRVRIK